MMDECVLMLQKVVRIRNIETIRKLAFYILLVYEGFRESYLIDGLCLTKKDATKLITVICVYFGLEKCRFLLVFLADDIIVSSRQALQRKVLDVSTNDINFLVLELSPDQPKLLAMDTVTILLNQITQYLRNETNEEDLSIITFPSIENFKTISLPLIAGSDKTKYFNQPSKFIIELLIGWLLGYFCIYKHADSSENDFSVDVGNQLMQYSIQAELESLNIKGRKELLNRKIDLMEFTIPFNAIHVDGSNLEEITTLKVYSLVDKLNERIGGLKMKTECASVLFLKRVMVSKTVHTITQKIVL